MFDMNFEYGVLQKDRYCTDVFTDKALAWLDRREKEKPFCLMLHFKTTHEPWHFHPRHALAIQDLKVQLRQLQSDIEDKP